jgi:PAS domain S-box-containing protein
MRPRALTAFPAADHARVITNPENVPMFFADVFVPANPMLTWLLHRRFVRSVASAASTVAVACQSRATRNVRVVGAVLALLTLVGGGLGTWDMYRWAIEDGKGDMRELGFVVAEQTSRYVQVIDLVLQEMQSRSGELSIRTPDEFSRRFGGEDTHRFLAERMKTLPQADTIALVDAEGAVLNTSYSTPTSDFSVADRDYFRYLRENRASEMFVSGPATSGMTGTTSMFLARRISGPDGAFLGVVRVAINVEYLLAFYQAISRERLIAVTLLRHDGLVLARYPTAANHRQSMPIASPWAAQVAAGGGTYRSTGYFTGTSSIVSVNPLRDYPLVIDVSIHDDDVLAIWWRQAAYTTAAEVMLAGAFVALFGMIARQMRRQGAHYAAISRTADALRESESRLRDFAELASDWFWEQDAELRFTKVGVATPLHAIDDRTHIGKRRWELNDTSRDPERWEKHQRDVLDHQRFLDFRYDRTSADGTLHHVSISGVPVYDGFGVFVGYRGIGRDITATVAAEVELRKAKDRAEQAEALLRDAVDSISAGFVIYDREDRFVMCNETYLQGYRKICPAIADLLLPGVLFEDMLRGVLAKSAGNTEAHGREAEWLEQRLLRHREDRGAIEHRLGDGSWFLVTDRRMKNGGTAGLRIDITALKQAQAALRESEARLDRAQTIAGIGSWELDVASGRYIWSKELYRIRGVSPEDFTPDIDNVAVYVHPDDYPPVRSWIADLIAGREADTREIRIIRPDGEVRLLRVEGRAMADPDGVIRRLAGTMQDITERRLIEQQLAQAQKMEAIGNLTGGMAHDFNNGLGIIIGNLDLLGRLVKAEPTAKELCDEARDGALRCAELIRLLLAFARRQPLHARQIDVNELTEKTAKLLSRTLGADITLTLHRGLALWPVVADPAQLEAALTNLANNARDAMPRGGQLDITTKTAELDAAYTTLHPEAAVGDYVLIEVSDSGTGIAPEIIGQIFEPFFTTKEQGRGTGLGLSMVFGFAKQTGGHLAVYSEPGLGTTFRIYLPRARVGDTEAAAAADPSPVMGGDETVLVVEDNAPLRRAAARELAELGYQVREAEHADAAVMILASADQVDLLFTDVVMPGTMDGLDLAQQATRLRPGLKVLLTSGFPGVRGADQRIADCPFPLLNKPYPHDDLARAVRAVLDRDDNQVPATGSPLAGSGHGVPGSELAIIMETV